MRSREDLFPAEPKIEAFLTDLAVRRNVAPATLTPLLQNHLAGVKTLHQQDLAQGHGEVYLPHALARKYPNVAKDWGWQYVFPARTLWVEPRSGITRRHHIDPSVINKVIKVSDVATTMIYTHILQQGGQGVLGPLDDLGV